MRRLTSAEAAAAFDRLPPAQRIATLSPAYVIADARRAEGLEPCFVGTDGPDGVWLHGGHLCAIDGTDMVDFQSPYGYGGPLSDGNDTAWLAARAQDYDRWCRDNHILVEFVRLHPMMAAQLPYPGTATPDRECVHIALDLADIRERYETRARTAIRKAEKSGVIVEQAPVEAIVTRFAEFYRDGMQLIGASAFYLFNDAYFEALAEIPGVTLLVASLDGEWLAASLFFRGPRVWEYHLSASTAQGRKLCAANLVIDRAAHTAAQVGATSLFLGGGTNRAPDNPLLFFKAGFSPARVPFRIGSWAHMPDVYARMRADRAHEATRERVLFYRS